jgi:hypothetical protein
LVNVVCVLFLSLLALFLGVGIFNFANPRLFTVRFCGTYYFNIIGLILSFSLLPNIDVPVSLSISELTPLKRSIELVNAAFI